MVEVADHVHKAGALGRLEQQERLQRSSRCMEPRNTERGQMWHPRVQQVTMDFWEWEERTGKKKDEGCPEQMGRTSVLDHSYLSEGGSSAFQPSELSHSKELEEVQEVLILPYKVVWGFSGCLCLTDS